MTKTIESIRDEIETALKNQGIQEVTSDHCFNIKINGRYVKSFSRKTGLPCRYADEQRNAAKIQFDCMRCFEHAAAVANNCIVKNLKIEFVLDKFDCI